MPWLYDTKTGMVEHQNELEYVLDGPGNLLGAGLVNLGIPDSDTSAQAVAAAQKYATAHKTTAPTTNNATANANAEQALSNATGLGGLDGFFNALGEKNTWIRVLKIVVGGGLVLFGITHMIGLNGVVADTIKKAPLPI